MIKSFVNLNGKIGINILCSLKSDWCQCNVFRAFIPKIEHRALEKLFLNCIFLTEENFYAPS